MIYVMLDLETLDVATTTAFLSVGAVCYNPKEKKIAAKAYFEFGLDEQLGNGRTVNGRTLAWWMDQSDDARAVFNRCVQSGHAFKDGLGALRNFLENVSGHRTEDLMVWGNGADFDIAILDHAYRSIGQTPPWRYSNVRCYRTLKNLLPHVEKPDFLNSVKHNALDDAVVQTKHLQLLLEELDRCTPQSTGSPDEPDPARTQSASTYSVSAAVTGTDSRTP